MCANVDWSPMILSISLLMPHPKWHRVFSAICLWPLSSRSLPFILTTSQTYFVSLRNSVRAVNTSYRFAAQGCSMKMWKVAVTHCIFIKSWCMYFVFRSSNIFHNEAVCKIWNSKWLKPRMSYVISLGTITHCFSSLPHAGVLNLAVPGATRSPSPLHFTKWFCCVHEEKHTVWGGKPITIAIQLSGE